MRPSVILLVLALAGCKRSGGAVDAGAVGPPAALRPSAAWLAGRLPPERPGLVPRDGGTLTIRLQTEPAGLTRFHDRMAEGTMVRLTGATVYETLGKLDRAHPEGPLLPSLAERWTQSPDHLTLTITLRKGVTFHDGSPFTSRDVKAVIDAVRDPTHLTATSRSNLADLDAVETPDAHTVVVRWRTPYFLAARNLLTALPMMPAAALKGDFDTLPIHRHPIGTGPFKFEKWVPGESISFVRNDAYWGPKAHLDRVVFRIVKDDTVAAQLWERGAFDLMTRIPPSVWRAVEAPTAANQWAFTGYHRLASFENVYSWIGWNEKRPFFADARVRRALAMLYPADVVARTVDLGLEPPTTCPYYAASSSCDPSVQRLPYDPREAAQLLDEAGWKDTNGDGVRDKAGVPFKFTFLATAYSLKLGRLVPLLQEELHRVGIEMDVEKVDASIYFSRLRAHDFDAAGLSWSNGDALIDLYQVFHSSQADGGSNFVSYANPHVDELLTRLRTEFDPERRAATEREVHRLLYADQVYLFLSLRPDLDAVRVTAHGLEPSLAWYDLSRAWLER